MSAKQIVYEAVDTPLGEMILGASDDGCCLCEFADRGGQEGVMARMRKRYGVTPQAGSNSHLRQLKKQLQEFFAGERKQFDLPLDLKGSPFQRAVWDQLLAIPYGETRSYGDIADALGKPGGSRAVGRANGDNYLAIVVPCHRVIQSDGLLRGYGGGLWRKKFLLELEQGVRSETVL